MIMQNTNLNTDNLYLLNKVDMSNETIKKPVENGDIHNKPKDVLTISEKGTIDLKLFNYFDKGGDAAKALSEESHNDKPFTIEPDFSNISSMRYTQMKAEIEQNYQDDVSTRNKYLRALDKALDDYIQLQEKNVKTLEDENRLNAIIKKEDNDVSNDETTDSKQTNNEAKDDESVSDKTADTGTRNKKIELYGTQKLYETNSENKKIIITEKILGKTESSYPDDISKKVDDFLIQTLNQEKGNDNVNHSLSQDHGTLRIQ